jgi:hypothetical protein
MGDTMIRVIFLVIIFSISTALACSKCEQSDRQKCDPPDWAYTYQNAEFAPDNAPCTVKAFHDKLIPLMEARWSHESSYIYEHACELYKAAKKIPGSLKCECSDRKEHFNRAAKDLVNDCARLKEISHGASSSMMYEQIKDIEDDFVRICNLSE